MKTIEPLFLDELREELNSSYDDHKKLNQLLGRISNIKIFDPACGSGNFLIITYKELRRLEHAILERQGELTGQTQQALLGSRINIENFYGIEIDDFAHEVAILSLWLAKHQMNLEFSEKFGIDLPLIPLKESGNIKQGNAAREDWNAVCSNIAGQEIYLIGNPPYLGSRNQKAEHKADKDRSIGDIKSYKVLDYVAIWLWKGAQYLLRNDHSKLAFVMTNSVVQGDHIANLWPEVLGDKLEIGFAYTSFKWANNAKKAAGVTVVIVALQSVDPKSEKRIFDNGLVLKTEHINAYLTAAPDVFFGRRAKPISNIPPMIYGSEPRENGHLLLNGTERDELLSTSPQAAQYLKKITGSNEYIKRLDRWCLWIAATEEVDAKRIPFIAKRLQKVAEYRETSERKDTQKFAAFPYKFTSNTYKPLPSIIVPIVFSESRDYIPAGFVDSSTVILNSAQVVYSPDPWVFGLIGSKMHMIWTKALAGQLETRIRYSSSIVYNNFPVPPLTSSEKELLSRHAIEVLDVRESHPDKTLADLYNPNDMPADLRVAHAALDDTVERIYRKRSFESDEERLACLFDLYKTMTAKEEETV